MSYPFERRLLQIVILLACLLPFSAGSSGILQGAAWLVHGGRAAAIPTDLDSHFRYLSGIFLGVGVAFASCMPAIERRGPRFRLLAALVVLGGLSRALSWAEMGPPSPGMRLGLVMELGAVPLLVLWQARIARRAVAAALPASPRPAP